jgi:hypothetical protein
MSISASDRDALVAFLISLTEDTTTHKCVSGYRKRNGTGYRLRPLRRLACVYAEAKPQ